MSTQACLIRGIGYKFDYDYPLFSFIEDKDEEFHFIDAVGLDVGYYELRDNKDSKNVFLGIVSDGMNGEHKHVLFITEASYILNTHGDPFWRNTFRNDDYVKNYCKQTIECVLRRELPEPQEFVFEHYQ